MSLLIAASIVFTLVALLFAISCVRHVRRRRPIRASRSLLGGAMSGTAGGASIMLLFSYYGYGQLIDEQRVSVIEFAQTTNNTYTARVMVDGRQDRLLELKGDEWQMDARVVSWKPPATLLGLEPIYQLDRLSGRYSDIGDERQRERTVHALSDELPLDVWYFAKRYPKLMPGVDAYYGTATFLPMADGARFEVSLTRKALIARPINDAAVDAVGSWGEP